MTQKEAIEFLKSKGIDDIHKYTASLLFHIPMDEVTHEQRSNAKAKLFGYCYAMGSEIPEFLEYSIKSLNGNDNERENQNS